jgi:hypothetical protein
MSNSEAKRGPLLARVGRGAAARACAWPRPRARVLEQCAGDARSACSGVRENVHQRPARGHRRTGSASVSVDAAFRRRRRLARIRRCGVRATIRAMGRDREFTDRRDDVAARQACDSDTSAAAYSHCAAEFHTPFDRRAMVTLVTPKRSRPTRWAAQVLSARFRGVSRAASAREGRARSRSRGPPCGNR